jgi:hypothetical protein
MDMQHIEIDVGGGKNRRKHRVPIPSDAVLSATAIELRNLGEGATPAAGKCGDCIALYVPPRTYTIQSVDPFTGDRGPIEEGGTIPEVCIFFHDIGTSVVYAYYDGDPVSLLHFGKRVAPPQPGLFDQEPATLVEGAETQSLETSFERNSALRKLCLDAKGYRCVACRMSLQERYGKAAEGLIHVHHLQPLAAVGQAPSVNPLTDLVPVCPNCHAVMHRRTPPYTPDEVRDLLQAAR